MAKTAFSWIPSLSLSSKVHTPGLHTLKMNLNPLYTALIGLTNKEIINR